MSNNNRVILDYHDAQAREQAADFILGLVKNGLTFEANQNHDNLVVTLTGGY